MTQSVIQMHCTLSCEMLWESGMSVTCSSPALLNPLHHSMGLAQGQGLVVGGGHCHHPRRYRCSRALCSADPPPESCPVWGLLVSLSSGFPVFTSTQIPCLDTDVFSLASSDMVGAKQGFAAVPGLGAKRHHTWKVSLVQIPLSLSIHLLCIAAAWHDVLNHSAPQV